MSRALEITVTPFLFGFGGYLLDGQLGTGPVFAAVLGSLGLLGVFLKIWLNYDYEMRQHEEARRERSAGRLRPLRPAQPTGEGSS